MTIFAAYFDQTVNSPAFQGTASQPLSYFSAEADSSTAIGHVFDTDSALSTAGAFLVYWRNFNTSQAGIDKDGQYENFVNGGGIVLRSPDGTRWVLTIDNTGTAVVNAA
jgi:hypothetical protein